MYHLLQDHFDLQGDVIDVDKTVAAHCGRRLSDFTHKLFKRFKAMKAAKGEEYARNHPPPQINLEKWARLIDNKWKNEKFLVTSCNISLLSSTNMYIY